MNKGQGATTIGAILLAGVMFQARSTQAPSSSDGTNEARSAAAVKHASGEGPWLASCKYWSAALSDETAKNESAKAKKSPALNLEIKQTEDSFESTVKGTSASAETECSADGWGIPERDSGHAPQISVIVATVPDPVHSHLALDFDRAIDAILLAASNNRYLANSYWLPWRSRSSALASAESASSTAEGIDQATKREKQPGLIVLRYAPDASELRKEIAASKTKLEKWKTAEAERTKYNTENPGHPREPIPPPDLAHPLAEAAYHRVVYLFLVAETPALGANGVELQAAFAYEQFLRERHNATYSVRRRSSPNGVDPGPLSIIGPFFSGSAASLHEGIEVAKPALKFTSVSIAGMTGASVAADELDPERALKPDSPPAYISFGENARYEQDKFKEALKATGYADRRIAILSEAGTVFGAATKCQPTTTTPDPAAPKLTAGAEKSDPCDAATSKQSYNEDKVLYLTFPRELSLLRNVQATTQGKSSESASSPPSPYLNLSLKDYNADDTVPSVSGTSPASIESQLMALARQLQRAHSQFIFISASNILDDIFLVQFLHRACPDARLVLFSGGDLLFERDGENSAYVGSISISPYLLSFLDFSNQAQWLHSDGQSEALYNAASYIFRDSDSLKPLPEFAGYLGYSDTTPSASNPIPTPDHIGIPLWATVIGSDGYYPLGILSWCASDSPTILPSIGPDSYKRCVPPANKTIGFLNRDFHLSPSLSWFIVDSLIILGCIFHICTLLGADYWSPFTRDLAIDENDQPHRRAVYLNIGTQVLVCMAFVVAYPLLRVGYFYSLNLPCYPMAYCTLIVGFLALCTTIYKTWRYSKPTASLEFFFFNFVAAFSLIFIVVVWTFLCHNDNPRDTYSFAGLFFSYRCLNPLSGVCPMVPVLWLLLAWYLWSIFQTARLRFSPIHRPLLPRYEKSDAPHSLDSTPYPLFVPDNALDVCSSPTDSCLFENITCLLITREVLRRFAVALWPPGPKDDPQLVNKSHTFRLTLVLAIIYMTFFALCVFSRTIQSLDRFLFQPVLHLVHSNQGPTLYEFLVTALFYPLLMVAFSGWLRAIMIWGALSRGLLEPLERTPLRFAFTRLKGGSWMTMLRESGLHLRWRDMSRTTESIRQLVNHPSLKSRSVALRIRLAIQHQRVNGVLQKLLIHIKAPDSPNAPTSRDGACPPNCWDLPPAPGVIGLRLIFALEKSYAAFSKTLLFSVLIPYWDHERTGLVEDTNVPLEEEPIRIIKDNDPCQPEQASTLCDLAFVRLCEELIIVRYVALIRAVLVNIRYLMLFVSTAFVFAILAWNSYPFHPHAFIDWCFTLLLVLIGTGFVSVFAQMHRNAILSRITDTKPNELGWDFYIRIITFGAIPVLTWLAYQFPQIGGSLFKILQPGLQVAK